MGNGDVIGNLAEMSGDYFFNKEHNKNMHGKKV